MSNIIHKVKDAVTHHGDKDNKHTSSTGTDANTYDSSRSSNHGPHDSNVANTADPRIDSDRSQLGSQSYNTTGTRGSTGAAGSTGAYGTTGTGNTASDAYDLSGSTNHGTHDSNIANKADPRFDSDRDGRAAHGSTGTGLGGSTGTYGSTGSTGYAPTGTTSHTSQSLGTGAGTTGAYGSTGSTGYAPTGTTSHTTQPLSTGAGSTGAYGTTGSTGNTASDAYDMSGSTNHGPHDSNVANKADPRFDSDRDGRATHGTTGLGGSTGGYDTTHSRASGPASSTAGPHSSNVANEADPRVDSDQSKKKEHLAGEYSGIDRFDKDVHKGSIAGGNQVIGLHGSKGPTTTKNFDQSQHESAAGAGSSYNTGRQSTAGPHNSDMMNKMDPRVDSDLDGSKTVGGDKTYAQPQTQRY